MKYQDPSTCSQTWKINSLLSRLKPERSNTQENRIETFIRSGIQSQNSSRQRLFNQKKLDPLAVDILHHRDHNILVFIPGPSQYRKRQEMYSKKFLYSKPLKTRFNNLKKIASTCNSFRVKKVNGLRQEMQLKDNSLKQSTRTPLQFVQQPMKPNLQYSKVLKQLPAKIQQFEQKPEKEEKKLKKIKSIKYQKPPIQKFLVNHKFLSQLQERYKLNEQKKSKSIQLSADYLRIKDMIKQNQLFSNSGIQKVQCQEPQISFFLNTLFSKAPNIIKKLFGQTGGQTLKLILNYQGCFRALTINYLTLLQQSNNNTNNSKFLWSQINSLWPQVLQQTLCTLFKRKVFVSMSINSLYEILTGLVLQEVTISEYSSQGLLEIISSIVKSSSDNIIIGKTIDNQFTLIQSSCSYEGELLLSLKKYIFQTVYSEFQPTPQILVSYLQENYKTIYLADLYPSYYFIYKKIEYSLGNDSLIRLQIPQETTIIFQISKQTIAFEAKVKLNLEQNRQQGLISYYSSYIKSSSGMKKQLKLLPGIYLLRLSDDKENIREYKFSIVMTIVCKKDISRWIKHYESD